MRNNNLKALVVAVGLLAVSGSASASWQDGWGVVNFADTNKEKIIYSNVVNPYNGEWSISTSQTNFNLSANVNNTTSSPNRNYRPAGYVAGIDWQSYGLNFTAVSQNLNVIWKSVGVTDNPLTCAQGRTCGEIARTVGKDKCTSRDMGLGISGSNWKTKINYLEALAGLISGTLSTGVSTCTSSSVTHTCYAGSAETPAPTRTYITVEHNAKWVWAQMTPTNGRITLGSNGNKDRFRALCTAAGGTTETMLTNPTCKNVGTRVSFETWDVFPVMPRPSTTNCRVTGIQ